MAHQRSQHLAVNRSGNRQSAVIIHMLPAMLPNPVVDRRISGTGIKGQQFAVAANPGNIGNAADIQDGQRLFKPGAQSIVKHRAPAAPPAPRPIRRPGGNRQRRAFRSGWPTAVRCRSGAYSGFAVRGEWYAHESL